MFLPTSNPQSLRRFRSVSGSFKFLLLRDWNLSVNPAIDFRALSNSASFFARLEGGDPDTAELEELLFEAMMRVEVKLGCHERSLFQCL